MHPLNVLCACLLAVCAVSGHAQQLNVSSGSLERIEDFPSLFVSGRNVDVWLPDGYSRGKKYAVLYMQDGQMLFDSASTWNRQEWCMDETASRLMKEGKVRDFIVVGIHNIKNLRHSEYMPQEPFESMSRLERDSLMVAKRPENTPVFSDQVFSDRYLMFIVRELKPYIDSAYSTDPGRESTFIGGSSMGGMISLYALCEYPEIFGGAACISIHWTGIFTTSNNPFPEQYLRYLKKHLPDPATHRIYFDHGTEGLDAMYVQYQAQADVIMKKKGYTSAQWMTREFPGEGHSEKAWARRLEIPLVFLLN